MSNTELYEAILKVQQDAPFIDKSAKNPFFKSKYADLPAIWSAIKQSMGDNGLIVVNQMANENGNEYIVTKIIHAKSGQEMQSVSRITLTKVGAQEYGSYITYMRRYALSAMLGLVTDEDDDASKADHAPKQADKKADTPKPKAEIKPLSGEEYIILLNSIKAANSFDDLKIQWDKVNAALPRMNKEMINTLESVKNDKKIELQKGTLNLNEPPVDDIPNFGGANE